MHHLFLKFILSLHISLWTIQSLTEAHIPKSHRYFAA
uniref:Uncharacterized protein n=1 Tax=Arundo donax TaxID=35708 RepID=A0A0A9GD72_ARUDO